MKRILMLTSAMTMCMALPALAGSQSSGTSMASEGTMDQKAQYFLKQMDKDSNGMVSKDEHDQFSENMFEQADANGDDEISMNELKAAKQKEMQQMQQSMNSGSGASGTGSMNRTGG